MKVYGSRNTNNKGKQWEVNREMNKIEKQNISKLKKKRQNKNKPCWRYRVTIGNGVVWFGLV